MIQVREVLEQVRKLRSQLRGLRDRASDNELKETINALDQKTAVLEGAGGGFRGGGGGAGAGEPSLSRTNGELLGLMGLVEGADVRPTTQAIAASEQAKRALTGVISRWRELREKDVSALNAQLVKAGLPALTF
jgi:hypothetical protein